MNTSDSIAISFLILGIFAISFGLLWPGKWEGAMENKGWRWGIFATGPFVIVVAAIITIIGGLYE